MDLQSLQCLDILKQHSKLTFLKVRRPVILLKGRKGESGDIRI